MFVFDYRFKVLKPNNAPSAFVGCPYCLIMSLKYGYSSIPEAIRILLWHLFLFLRDFFT